MTRPLYEIAKDIRKHWQSVYFGAAPYLEAMDSMAGIGDKYGVDDGRYIVNYFLGNAQGFRGPDAKRIKAELKLLLKGA